MLHTAGVDEQPAEQRSHGNGHPYCGAENGERPRALSAAEILLHHAHDLRADEPGSDALDGTCHVQQHGVLGQASGRGRQREQRYTDDEEWPAPVNVTGAAGRDEADAEREGVTGEDPLQLRVSGAQTQLDRGQRHVDDAHINQRHEQHHAENCECAPPVRFGNVTIHGGLGRWHP